MAFWDDPDYEKSGPIRVDNGIRARSKRGAIGSSWWSRRFVDVLESLDLGSRLASGRAYARSGQVLGLQVTAGSVAASVQGSRAEPYRLSIGLRVIWPAQWERVERAIAAQAIFNAKLLAGDLPEDLEQVFDELGLALFPRTAEELAMECSCPDHSVPCKHIAATLYLLAEAFDDDPFLLLAWRGRNKAELLASLRGREASTVDGPARSPWDALRAEPAPTLDECVADYFSCRGRLVPVDGRQAEIIVPDAVLRERDPLPVEVRGHLVTDLLRPAYLAMTGSAERVPPG
ncbi:MAG: SWIM zinc finger family protein [Labedaea sp.]